MKRVVVILAGGEGHRAGGNVPKQFVDLCGLPVVWWSVKAFHEAYPDIVTVMVVHPGYFEDWDIQYRSLPAELRYDVHLCCGGRDRRESVCNGLLMARDVVSGQYGENQVNDVFVAIHDGARPLISADMIRRGFSVAKRGCGLVPAVKAVNSLRRIGNPAHPFGNPDSFAVDRSYYVEVQTPQIFALDEILEIHRALPIGESFTDDASMAESCGKQVILYEGIPENIKITHPADFTVASAILQKRHV